jgi:hypothetical protein
MSNEQLGKRSNNTLQEALGRQVPTQFAAEGALNGDGLKGELLDAGRNVAVMPPRRRQLGCYYRGHPAESVVADDTSVAGWVPAFRSPRQRTPANLSNRNPGAASKGRDHPNAQRGQESFEQDQRFLRRRMLTGVTVY